MLNGYRQSAIWDEFSLQIFFRIKKYKFGAFQRRIGRHRVTPGYDFRYLYTSFMKQLKTCTNVVKNSPGQRIARYTLTVSI